MGFTGRFITLNTLIRVNQIEVRHDKCVGMDESQMHTPETVAAFRDAVSKGFPGGRITWAFTWQALTTPLPQYAAIREKVRLYCRDYGDEAVYAVGGYFANAYNTREGVNQELQEGIARLRDFMGPEYQPKIVIAGFLAAENQRYLSEELGIHVAQGNIWSQYAIDNQDGDGSVSYPYYPSREHFLKPAQTAEDFIDCVNLDGWTVDFLAARREGFQDGFNSRMGVGPIETLNNLGKDAGLAQMLHTTAVHMEQNMAQNGFAWVTSMWENCLVSQFGCLEQLTEWLTQIRLRWPDTQMPAMSSFGLAWREAHPSNQWDYRFDQDGSGISGSDADKHIRWYMNPQFRLALLWPIDRPNEAKVIDFTRYDIPAAEPTVQTRFWSLLGKINQKQTRPQDKPVSLTELEPEDREIILARYPELGPLPSEITILE